MRQLAAEGWMHNRARLITASFLAKTLYLDWRLGAAHFMSLLVDADVANNQLNWQWVAGTGTDTRPNRVLNPIRQAQRYDPNGDYVRRWIPELADICGPDIHTPWQRPGQPLIIRRASSITWKPPPTSKPPEAALHPPRSERTVALNKTTLTGTGLAVAAASGVGSIASRRRSEHWYARLRKPRYVPPNYVFPLAWTTLYGDIAVSSAAAIDRLNAENRGPQARKLVAALATNLVLNAGWSWLFFRHRKLGASAAAAAVLTLSSSDLARRVGEANQPAGIALTAYPLWCAFATLLSTRIWWLNR
ncbi:FAD binding domain of DNA photolyase family protein [Mycobacterium xenopi 4042]|uniref:FAD binding domain of DNA photolyase family protein n=1 Tax=Mycobacterium xenopi 4042 TaxID=1299334 RepID=X8DMZ5_MYCXE|nr:FAD binding domain of DNA photolyase family protein [Mycobacterium xenopi 4042]